MIKEINKTEWNILPNVHVSKTIFLVIYFLFSFLIYKKMKKKKNGINKKEVEQTTRTRYSDVHKYLQILFACFSSTKNEKEYKQVTKIHIYKYSSTQTIFLHCEFFSTFSQRTWKFRDVHLNSWIYKYSTIPTLLVLLLETTSHANVSRSIKRGRKRKFVPGVWTSLTDIHLNGDDTYDPRSGTARRSKPVNFRCTDRGCRGILKRGCTPYRQGVVEICHTSREQTWCLVSNSIEFLPIIMLLSISISLSLTLSFLCKYWTIVGWCKRTRKIWNVETLLW